MKNYRVPESIKHDFQTRFVNHKASKTEYKQEGGVPGCECSLHRRAAAQ